MKLTIVYDNTTESPDLVADWGWSCLVQTGQRKILFDTGGNGRILLENMCSLGINPDSIDDVVVSHPDFDHIGGLSAFLNANPQATVHVPVSFRGIHYKNRVLSYNEPAEIYRGVFLTGELAGREQSLAIHTPEGLVLVVGCGHPGIALIMASVEPFGSVHALIGGLHGFDEFRLLRSLHRVCPTHCTRQKDKIKELFPDKYISGGVGKIIDTETW